MTDFTQKVTFSSNDAFAGELFVKVIQAGLDKRNIIVDKDLFAAQFELEAEVAYKDITDINEFILNEDDTQPNTLITVKAKDNGKASLYKGQLKIAYHRLVLEKLLVAKGWLERGQTGFIFTKQLDADPFYDPETNTFTQDEAVIKARLLQVLKDKLAIDGLSEEELSSLESLTLHTEEEHPDHGEQGSVTLVLKTDLEGTKFIAAGATITFNFISGKADRRIDLGDETVVVDRFKYSDVMIPQR